MGIAIVVRIGIESTRVLQGRVLSSLVVGVWCSSGGRMADGLWELFIRRQVTVLLAFGSLARRFPA